MPTDYKIVTVMVMNESIMDCAPEYIIECSK